MPFDLANNYTRTHLIPQPSDLALNPPESYLLISDFLIIACGILYALCYFFYITRTYVDRVCAGTVQYLAGTMAYEIYYAFATTTTVFERCCFLVWFMFDVSFAAVALVRAYPRERRGIVMKRMVALVAVGMTGLHVLCKIFPDEREQVTAYWMGILLQLPISWGALLVLIQRGDTKGQSLEIWITRYLGCYAAYGVFFWRYWNAPQNWMYVGSWWSIGIIVVTLIPETVYPFVHVWMHAKGRAKVKSE